MATLQYGPVVRESCQLNRGVDKESRQGTIRADLKARPARQLQKWGTGISEGESAKGVSSSPSIWVISAEVMARMAQKSEVGSFAW